MRGGIYLILQPGQQIADPGISKALGDASVGGVFVRAAWRDVEPSKGEFDWRYLDAQVAAARQRGKAVSIALAAGMFTPTWVFADGAASYSTAVELGHPAPFCEPITIPVPWDASFLLAWSGVVKAMGARYGANPAVSLIKFGGINYKTWEILLPTHGTAALPLGQARARGCPIPDEVQEWAEKGYTSQRLMGAFETILKTYAEAFPSKPIALMTGTNGFPPSDGEALGAADLYQEADHILGPRLVGQDNALSAGYVSGAVAALTPDHAIGFQFGWPVSGSHDHTDAKNMFSKAVAGAIRAGACYLEVFPKDAARPELAKVLADASRQLLANCP